MSTSLYSQADELTALHELIEMDHGEITEEHESLMAELYAAIENKTDAVVEYSQMLDDQINMAEARKKEMDQFIKARKNALDRLKSYVMNCMDKTGTKAFTGSLFEIKERKPSQVLEIVDDSLVPVEYTTVIPAEVKVDKSALKKAVKNGEVNIEGVSLIDGKRSIQFKAKPVSKKKGA